MSPPTARPVGDESRIAQDRGPQRQVFVDGVEQKRSALLGMHPPISPRIL